VSNFANIRGSILLSVGGHVLALLFAQFGLPHVFTLPQVDVQIIPVELVVEDTVSAPPPPATPEPEPKPEAAAPPPPPVPEPAPQPPAEPEIVEAPPPPPAEKPKPPEKKEPPKPEPPKPEPSVLAQAKPLAKPKPPKPQKDFASVLKNLEQLPKQTPPTPKPSDATPPKKGEPTPPQQLSERASLTEIERLKQIIRQQIQPCWSPPVGAEQAKDLVVTIFIRVDRGGTVTEARVVDGTASSDNPFVRAAADAARRAVLNPACQPFRLPQEHYDLWKEIRFNFDPKGMLG